jgi:hypothetical protein
MADRESATLSFIFEATDKNVGSVSKKLSSAVTTLERKIIDFDEALKAGDTSTKSFGRAGWLADKVGLDPLQGKLLAERFKKVAVGAGIFLKVIKPLSFVAGNAAEDWMDLTKSMLSWRRDLGMTFDEVMDLQTALIQTTNKYGIALGQLGDIARFVAAGSKKARENFQGVTEAIAQHTRRTGADIQTSVELYDLLLSRLDMTPDNTEKSMIGLTRMAREGRVSIDKLQTAMLGYGEAMDHLSADQTQELMGSIAALLSLSEESGFRFDDVNAAVGKLTDSSGNLGMMFNSLGFDLGKTLDVVLQGKDDLFEMAKSQNKLTSQSARRELSALAAAYDLTLTEITALHDMYPKMGERAAVLHRTMSTDLEGLRRQEEQLLSPLQKLDKAWQILKTGVMTAGQDYLDWLDVGWHDLDFLSQKAVEFAESFTRGDTVGKVIAFFADELPLYMEQGWAAGFKRVWDALYGFGEGFYSWSIDVIATAVESWVENLQGPFDAFDAWLEKWFPNLGERMGKWIEEHLTFEIPGLAALADWMAGDETAAKDVAKELAPADQKEFKALIQGQTSNELLDTLFKHGAGAEATPTLTAPSFPAPLGMSAPPAASGNEVTVNDRSIEGAYIVVDGFERAIGKMRQDQRMERRTTGAGTTIGGSELQSRQSTGSL